MQAIKILAAIAAVTLGAASLAQNTRPSPGTVAASSSLPVAVPYTVHDGLILLRASIGTGPLQDAVLATALPLTIITTDLATRQGIQGQGASDIPTLNGLAQVKTGYPQSIGIGSMSLANVPIGIFDLFMHLSSRPSAVTPTVWLGWTALGALNLTIDPAKSELIFQPTNAPLAEKAIALPFTLQDGRIYLQTKLNGHRSVRMLVDTASVGTLLPADAARALRLPELASVPIKGVGGKFARVTVVTLNELNLAAGLSVKELRALYISEGDGPDLGLDTGVLGTDVLLKHRVTINFGRSIIAFEKLEPKKDVVNTPAITPRKSAPPANPSDQPPVSDPNPADP